MSKIIHPATLWIQSPSFYPVTFLLRNICTAQRLGVDFGFAIGTAGSGHISPKFKIEARIQQRIREEMASPHAGPLLADP